LIHISAGLARRHYAEHKGKPFYRGLLRFITSGPAAVAGIEGKNAIEVCRKMLGATSGGRAEPGTIRGDLSVSDRYNLVHASDSRRSARREIGLYFRPSELVKYPLAELRWFYDLNEKKPL
ncbi:MAG: nucleoside-diphosphate kinase, partial [Planctomycetota bacterium]|nr:nucleoside-diphosphate kinase [Planctomycetota bacterium]